MINKGKMLWSLTMRQNNSFNLFFKEMYGEQAGKFVFR